MAAPPRTAPATTLGTPAQTPPNSGTIPIVSSARLRFHGHAHVPIKSGLGLPDERVNMEWFKPRASRTLRRICSSASSVELRDYALGLSPLTHLREVCRLALSAGTAGSSVIWWVVDRDP